MKIILLGPPGAGKGTQAEELKEKLGLLHISTGDIFREYIKNGSPLGKKIKNYVETGELVPDEIVVDVVGHKIRALNANTGFVLDGFPRTRTQAELLDKTLSQIKITIDKVFYFETTEEMIISRLSGRRTCPNCGMNYHIKNLPPQKEGLCNNCDVKLSQRKDDEPDTVHNRLLVYRKKTQELIDYYKKRGILETINGDLSKDEAFVELQAKMKSGGK